MLKPEEPLPAMDRTLISFDGLSRPVALVGCDELLEIFDAVVKGWRHVPASADAGEPVITITADGPEYLIDGPVDDPFYEDTGVSAVCSFIVDFVHSYILDNPDLLCLHCGAAEIAGRLVVFPSATRAGKSTLISRLSGAGVRVFTDDLLPITPDDRGMGLGIAPRLRLPLPEIASEPFRRFVVDHAGPDDPDYLYLDLPTEVHATHGETAPLGAVVLLQREAGARAELLPAATGQSLKHLIVQNLARDGAATAMIDRLHAIVSALPCFTLRYSDLDEAAELLKSRFADWEALSDEEAGEAPHPAPPAIADEHLPARMEGPRSVAIDGARYSQTAGVQLRVVDGHLFLADAEDRAVFHLNTTGAGIWNLLENAASHAEAVDVLGVAFPNVDRTAIAHNVAEVMSDLYDAGLIRRA